MKKTILTSSSRSSLRIFRNRAGRSSQEGWNTPLRAKYSTMKSAEVFKRPLVAETIEATKKRADFEDEPENTGILKRGRWKQRQSVPSGTAQQEVTFEMYNESKNVEFHRPSRGAPIPDVRTRTRTAAVAAFNCERFPFLNSRFS